MAILYVTEFAFSGKIAGSGVPVASGRPTVRANNVVIGGGSLQSNPFGTTTLMIRVHTDAICSILIGSNPTAVTNSDARMAANQTEYFQVNPGDRIAVISST